MQLVAKDLRRCGTKYPQTRVTVKRALRFEGSSRATGGSFRGLFRPGSPVPDLHRLSLRDDLEFLSPAANLRRPPSRAHQQKSPVLQKLRRLPFKRMPDKLQRPSCQKQSHRDPQRRMPYESDQEQRQRKYNHRNPERMRHPIDRMLVALRILPNPAVPTSSA